jgi:hypothetical protein
MVAGEEHAIEGAEEVLHGEKLGLKMAGLRIF